MNSGSYNKDWAGRMSPWCNSGTSTVAITNPSGLDQGLLPEMGVIVGVIKEAKNWGPEPMVR